MVIFSLYDASYLDYIDWFVFCILNFMKNNKTYFNNFIVLSLYKKNQHKSILNTTDQPDLSILNNQK
jgi:hypothetical protein